MTERAWSDYQNDIFNAVLLDPGDLVVLARAGTGKTTTMVEATIRFCHANPRLSVLTCAFNKRNAVELDSRLRDAGLDWRRATAKTLNSVGLSTVKRSFGKGVKVDPKKGRRIAKAVAREFLVSRNLPLSGLIDLAVKIGKLSTWVRVTLAPLNFDVLFEVCTGRAIADDLDEAEVIVGLTLETLKRSREERDCVDFDDQLWFPHFFDLQPWTYDLVIVDEAQDMNASQLALARRSVKRGGRLIAVGDTIQAIYGWRGADSDFLDRMIRKTGARTLPLPRTYRCGHSIVREAKRLVPDYEADPENHEGTVRTVRFEKFLAEIDVGDFGISRTNAPLLGICFEVLKRGIPVNIQGRDVMGRLVRMIDRSGCADTGSLLTWLDDYQAEEREKLEALDADDAVREQLSDRCACLRFLAAERSGTCTGLTAYVEGLFSDRDEVGKVTLSTTHRAKGMERDRVWLLRDTFRSGGQEDNCLYVAITRAKFELIYVVGGGR